MQLSLILVEAVTAELSEEFIFQKISLETKSFGGQGSFCHHCGSIYSEYVQNNNNKKSGHVKCRC